MEVNSLYYLGLSPSVGLGESPYMVEAPTEHQAVRKLLFRLLKKQGKKEKDILIFADKVIQQHSYKVISVTPLLPKNPKPFQQGSGTTLRDIGDDMDKPPIQPDDEQEDEDDEEDDSKLN